MTTDKRDNSIPLTGGALVLADGKVEVSVTGQTGRDAVALAASMWKRGYPSLRRALNRRTSSHLTPKPHRFYRTANDMLVFSCFLDADGDAKCHVMASSADNTFAATFVGNNYWVYKSGVVNRNSFHNATSGSWLLEELHWEVPAIADESATREAAFTALLNPPDEECLANIVVRAGIWCTCNGSVVAVSPVDHGRWGATVALGGHHAGDAPGSTAGSLYRLTDSGAVFWPDNDLDDLPNSLQKLAAISGMALIRPLDILDEEGNIIEILEAVNRDP